LELHGEGRISNRNSAYSVVILLLNYPAFDLINLPVWKRREGLSRKKKREVNSRKPFQKLKFWNGFRFLLKNLSAFAVKNLSGTVL
jgi:uncharacterized membrane protein